LIISLPLIAAAAITKNQKLLLIGKFVLLPVDDEPFPSKSLEVVVAAFADGKVISDTINKTAMVSSFKVFMTVKDKYELYIAMYTYSNFIPLVIKEKKSCFLACRPAFW
jgi:hypothetical protein